MYMFLYTSLRHKREKQTLKVLDELLQREVTRGEFLKIIGVAAVGVFGIHNLISGINQSVHTLDKPERTQQTARHGFGSRRFGA